VLKGGGKRAIGLVKKKSDETAFMPTDQLLSLGGGVLLDQDRSGGGGNTGKGGEGENDSGWDCNGDQKVKCRNRGLLFAEKKTQEA